MKTIITNFTCLILFAISAHGQVDFSIETLEETNSEKPIFIDVYATWCGPCKLMDRTTFQDSTVSAILNDNFTCLKWDGEDDKFKELVKHFEVKAYPSLLFLNNKHELISKQIGLIQAEALSTLSTEILEYSKHKPLDNLNISSLSLDKSISLLSTLSWLKSDKKNQLLDHVLEFLGTNDSLWTAHHDLIATNAHNDLDLEYIEQLIERQEPISIFSNKSMEAIAKTQMAITEILTHQLERAKIEADFELYERVSKLRAQHTLPGRGRIGSYNTKQLKTDRLDYYRHHNLIDDYKPLADSLIEEFILPHSPKYVLNADKSEIKRGDAFIKQLDLVGHENMDSTSVEFYRNQHPNGLKLANRLDDVANGILQMHDDKQSLEDALIYSTLSYDYLELPKYLITKAKICSKLGENEVALKTLNQAMHHQFYDPDRLNIDDVLKNIKGTD